LPTCLSDRTGLSSHSANCWSRCPLLSVEILVSNFCRIQNVLRFYALFFQEEETSLAHPILSQMNTLPSYFSKLPLSLHVCQSRKRPVLFTFPNKICISFFPTCCTSSSALRWQFNHTLISKGKRCAALLYLINFLLLGPIIFLSILLAHNLCSDSNKLQICALYVPSRENSVTA